MARSRSTKWLWLGGAALALVALALILPFLVPLTGFIPRITTIASQELGQPVAIAELQLRLWPAPRADAKGIRVGKDDDVRIEELVIVPDLMSWLAGPKSIREIRATKLEVRESALAMIGAIPKGQGDAVAVRRVVLREVTFHHSTIKLPPFDLRAELGQDYAVEQALFTTRDGALKLAVDPQGGGVKKLELTAKNWHVPTAAAALSFDSLQGLGTLRGKVLELSTIDGKLYSGSVTGNAKADWSKQWQLGGQAVVTGVDVAKLQQAIGRKPALTGKLNATIKYSASAKSPEQLADALALDGPFDVTGGALQGMDLSKVASLNIGGAALGGATRFDALRGTLHVRGKRVRITALCAKSSLLAAGGTVEVAPDQKLTGKLDVSVAGTRGLVGVPVALSGTTSDPVIRPAKSYTIGAAIGSVLLPGIGTALGAAAGSRVEGGKSGC